MAPRKAVPSIEAETAARKGRKTRARASETEEVEGINRGRMSQPDGRITSTTSVGPAASVKQRHNATEIHDAPDTHEQRLSKRAKLLPKSLDAKEKDSRPAKRSRKSTVKTPRRVSKPSETHPVINQAPSDVLTVFMFGSGENGELGMGPKVTDAPKPHRNPFLSKEDASGFRVVQVACGGMHAIALTRDNKIVTWGVNDDWALGRDTDWDGGLRDADTDSESDNGDLNPFKSTPTNIPPASFPLGTKFVQVSAGDSCSFALTGTGFVYGWGTFRRFIEKLTRRLQNPRGDKKFGYLDGNLVEIICGENHALALDATGRVWGWGIGEQNELGRRPYIASGEHHSFAVDSNDDVWAWGQNNYGQAGYATGAGGDSAVLPYPMKIRDLCGQGVRFLDGGMHHSAAVTKDGRCLVWGRMDGGQLGVEFTPQQLDDTTLIRYDQYGKPRICLRPTPISVTNVVDVGCGTDHTIFITREGRAYSTGLGSQGQLGLGFDDDVDVAQCIMGKSIQGEVLVWAGAGGQFSAIAVICVVP